MDSDIARLLTVFQGGRADRVPNFEIVIDRRNLRAILGREPSADSLWTVPPAEAVEVALRVRQDAIPCPLQSPLPACSVTEDTDPGDLPRPDVTGKREKMEAYLAAVRGTGLGVCPCLSGPFTVSSLTCGPVSIQSFMEMIYTAPRVVEALLDFYTEYTLSAIRAIRDLPFHFFYIGDDVTDFVSPAHLDALWAPRHERIIRAAQETGRPILCHCCGPQEDVLPYFERWGVSATHPLQADRNDIYAVRERYPNLTLVGNVDVNLLSFGTPAAVAADTLEHLERLGRAGRYVVCSSHSIIDSVKPENYRAMIETAWQWRA